MTTFLFIALWLIITVAIINHPFKEPYSELVWILMPIAPLILLMYIAATIAMVVLLIE